MDKILAILVFITALGVIFFGYPAGFTAVLVLSVFAILAVFLINKNFETEEKIFLRRLFIIALLLRVVLATITYVFQLESFFGGDSTTYDEAGYALYNYWFGNYSEINQFYLTYASRSSGSGFGMAYIVAVFYSIIGRNTLAIQLFNSVLGAGTAILLYTCAKHIFSNVRVAKFSSILVAVFPSLVLWSSQGLKDGIICFLLALAMNTLFSLQKRFSLLDCIMLILSLVGIYTLRFYIFFAFAVAIFGSLILSLQKTATSILRQIIVFIIISISLTYFGVIRNAQENLTSYGDLQKVQTVRQDMAKSAESGFGEDIDVSTPTGALSALPIGLAYLMLGPFPWQISNFRQAITLPELIIWWSMIPFMIIGFWYTVRNRLRESIAVILLTLLLTISYSIFQGNVGTAYRMRAQMQIFYLIFVGVGIVLWQERRENIAALRNFSRYIHRK